MSLADPSLAIPSDGGDTCLVSLADGWNDQADNWIAWAREPGHDAYWRHHRRQLLGLLPPPRGLTLDIGCGEGRVSRDLALLGHNVVGFDLTEAMVRAATDHPDRTSSFTRADAAALPVADSVADLVVSFMALQDTDAAEASIAEAARVLAPGGRLHLATVHPLNSAGNFAITDSDNQATDHQEPGPMRPFVIDEPYTTSRRTADQVERDGLTMRFDSDHHPLELYCRWLERSGFVIERLREPTDTDATRPWFHLPLFVHITAVKLPWKPLDRRVFHITDPATATRLAAGEDAAPPSLDTEGFVHLSTAAQVVSSTERHFEASADLRLVELDPELVTSDIRWPEVYPGERFPHLHGPIDAAALVRVIDWNANARAHWSAAP